MSKLSKEAMRAAMQAHIDSVSNKPIVKHDYQVKNCITYWYKKLLSVPVKMPETIIIQPDVGLYDLMDVLEVKPNPELDKKFDDLAEAVRHACGRLGYPAFLRTGTFSGKHEWESTCFIQSAETKLKRHLGALIESAAMRDQALDVFAVREFLPTKPLFYAFSGKMPITRERRLFVRDGRVIGQVPYWPYLAFRDQWTSIPDWEPIIRDLIKEPDLPELVRLTEPVAAALDGEWSVDWLHTERGWYLTDCALGPMSYGWNTMESLP